MKKYSTAVIAVVIMLFCTLNAVAADAAGTTALSFLKIGAGARPAGMGDAFGAVSNDSTAIYWNPAGLTQVEGRDLSLMHAVWVEGIAYEWISYAQEMGGGSIGAAVQSMSYGSLVETDDTGLVTGSFSPSDLAVTIGYAKEISGIPLGVNLKYISSTIKQTVSAVAIDAGGIYRLMDDKLSLALVIQNLGSAVGDDALPMNIRIGSSYSVSENWTAALDVNQPSDNEMNFCIGTEYVYKAGDSLDVCGRLGYSTKTKDTGGTNGITLGIGASMNSYYLDISYVPMGDLGVSNNISFGMKF